MHDEDEIDKLLLMREAAFYYDQASAYERALLHAVYLLQGAVVLGVNTPRDEMYEGIDDLEKETRNAEHSFVEVANIIRDGPAYRALTQDQREKLELNYLTVRFD